ncbi:MAG: hypothetical protein RLZZ417_3257 [Bacteroidota bacterium]|jgi:hypothetical protein
MLSFFNLSITAFETYEDISWGYFWSVDSYQLQINPGSVSCSYGKNEGDDEPSSANGGAIPQKSPTYFKETVSFKFTLDLTGVIPSVPDGDWYWMLPSEISYFMGLEDSIEKLKGVTIYPLRSTHAPPFVHLVWGDISLKGVVTDLGIEYTYFNSTGSAVRAEISITIEEFINREVEESKYQSPDITRIPTIKAGDTLPALCKSFYSDKKYYLKIAEINNLPSFRKLKLGEKLLFPPLEK